MLLFGWFRRPIILAAKADLCGSCGQLASHLVVRLVTWAHVFYVPVLLVWVAHRLVCTSCVHDQKLGWLEVRRALRERRLPRPVRPHFETWARTRFEETNRMPAEAEFDPIELNPKRGAWDLWLKAWPTLVAGLILYSAVLNVLRSGG